MEDPNWDIGMLGLMNTYCCVELCTILPWLSLHLELSLLKPWKLDSSISAENRELIENMLLEEQYPPAEHSL